MCQYETHRSKLGKNRVAFNEFIDLSGVMNRDGRGTLYKEYDKLRKITDDIHYHMDLEFLEKIKDREFLDTTTDIETAKRLMHLIQG